ncbi:hypothetical protein V1520DRAFT_354144 [Lipomyces starkeyi]|uniref:Uncharacterized protein n=1 Tax=Lipomyces starkeyi NRRL Y-11557 TaxID=675824 RepID=A0A1E3Q6A1_LIPST|nr:hypothetical protein LIPSTDRAFT_3531 [Lipomyces starkeyi NRRL Y-11557]
MPDVSTTAAPAPNWRRSSNLSLSDAWQSVFVSRGRAGAPNTDSDARVDRPAFYYTRKSYSVQGDNWDTILLNDAAIDTGAATSSTTSGLSDTDNVARIMGAYCLWPCATNQTKLKNEELCFDEEYIPRSTVLEEKRTWDLFEIDEVCGRYAEDGVCTSESDAWRPLVMREIGYRRLSTASWISQGSSSDEELDNDDLDKYYSSETSTSTPNAAMTDERMLRSVQANVLRRSLSELRRRFSGSRTAASKRSTVPMLSSTLSSQRSRENDTSGTKKSFFH